MVLFRQVFTAIALTAIAGGAAFAQSSAPPATADKPAATSPAPSTAKPAKPSNELARKARKEWDGISTITRRQWASMKGKWASEKVKWTACNRQARAQKLSTTDRWTAVGKCMMQ